MTGFLGGSANRPSPLRQKEVDEILMRMQEGAEKPRPKTLWEVGEMVRVKDGPFTDFNGNVEEVNYEPVACVGDDFRALNTGRARIRPG